MSFSVLRNTGASPGDAGMRPAAAVRAKCVPAALVLGLLAGAAVAADPVFGSSFEAADPDGTIVIDTPAHSHTYTGCGIEAMEVIRHGTVSTVIAYCGSRSTEPQRPGWQPAEHPDGGVLHWDGRMRLDATPAVFLHCVLTDYRSAYGQMLLLAECLDDPHG